MSSSPYTQDLMTRGAEIWETLQAAGFSWEDELAIPVETMSTQELREALALYKLALELDEIRAAVQAAVDQADEAEVAKFQAELERMC